jgi:2',3'-cyclic-nucleotide 2'-phosphodiesterase (5'-nucleotidase family)
VDLIVGGHSHAFLWPDPAEPPAFYRSDGQDGCCQKYEHDEIWGAYPTYVSGKEKEVPVFQASWGSRYMGKIVLTFEPESSGGNLSGITSDIALLGGPKSDQHVAQDEEALQLIDDWRSW